MRSGISRLFSKWHARGASPRGSSKQLAAAAWSVLEALEFRRLFSHTYYFSAAGSDNNDGLDPTAPFQTLDVLHTAKCQPAAGDSFLFRSGDTFDGKLGTFSDLDSLTFGIYGGSDHATINTSNEGDVPGIESENSSFITIKNLDFVGPWSPTNQTPLSDGITFLSDDLTKQSNITIENVSITGYGGVGIGLRANRQGNSYENGYSDVNISYAAITNTNDYGILIGDGSVDYTTDTYSHNNVLIDHCTANFIYGYAQSGTNSAPLGSGILVAETKNGTIQNCVVHDNGSGNNNSGGGPVGIWMINARYGLIQRNESYNNQKAPGNTGSDGGGFDLDNNTIDTIVQYNYSHDNQGAGYLLYDYDALAGTTSNTRNTIRYNISENDAGKHQDGIRVNSGTGGTVTSAQIYNNIVFMNKGSLPALGMYNSYSGMTVRNNILYTTGSSQLATNLTNSSVDVDLDGNDYYNPNATSLIVYKNGAAVTLSGLQSTYGEEKDSSGNPTGFQVDPALVWTANGTTGDAKFRLLSTSPLIDQARPQSNGPTQDYFGTSLPQGARADVGVYEAPEFAPLPASNLTVTTIPSTSGATLGWRDNSNNETLFRVERSPDGRSSWTTIGTSSDVPGAGNIQTFTDATAAADTLYYWRVWAVSGSTDAAAPTLTQVMTSTTRLYVQGTSGNDTIAINLSGTTLVAQVPYNGVTYTENTASASVASMVIDGSDGSDAITISSAVTTPATITGGNGDDSIAGGSGNDSLDGGAGNDTLRGGLGADTFSGGSGIDTVTYDERTTAVSITLDGNANDGAPNEGDNVRSVTYNGNVDVAEIFVGGQGGDTFNGTPPSTQLVGPWAPNNPITFLGGDGNDTMSNGLYVTKMDGQGGDDVLNVNYAGIQQYATTIYGSDGNDTINVSAAGATIYGGNGNDTFNNLTSSTGSGCVMYGDADNDTFNGTVNGALAGPVTMYGGDGNDTLWGSSSADSMMGENGDDYISGADGNDTIIGGAGSDRMLGGNGDDYFYAQDGTADNGVFGNAGNDTAYLDLVDTNWTSLEVRHYP